MHLGLEAKVRLYRYEQWIPAKWAELHGLFTLACSARSSASRSSSMRGRDTTTIEHEYLLVLILELMNAGNLTAAPRMGRQRAPRMVPAAAAFALEASSVTLVLRRPRQTRGLARRGPAPLEGARAVPRHAAAACGPDAARRRARAEDQGEPLSDRTPRRSEQLALLTKLASQVDPEFKPFARRGERTADGGIVDAIVGFAKIASYFTRRSTPAAERQRQELRRHDGARGVRRHAATSRPAPRARAAALRAHAAPGGPWEVKDVSQTGFRLIAPMSVANAVTLGTLVAIRPHGQRAGRSASCGG